MTSLSIDSKALVALNDDYDKENIWWKSALFETIGYECDSDITTLKRLHKRACSQFFRGSISKEVFCQICFLTSKLSSDIEKSSDIIFFEVEFQKQSFFKGVLLRK